MKTTKNLRKVIESLLDSSSMQLRVKPSIFIPLEPMSLEDVLLEQYENFDIYWYHWPMDGIFPGGDYEPVIVVYSTDSKICYLIVRRGWEYKFNSVDELEQPIEVIFETLFHHPFPRTKFDSLYNFRKAFLSEKDYDPKIIQPSEISEKFRTGKDHPTGRGRAYEDPAVIAQRIFEDECKSNK